MFVDPTPEHVLTVTLATPERGGEKYPSPLLPGPCLRCFVSFQNFIFADCFHAIAWFELLKLEGSIVGQPSIDERATEAMTRGAGPEERVSIDACSCNEEEE